MFRHLLPKFPEEVPIISEDYQIPHYEARNWRDLVSFLLRTHTQHLAPFTAGLFSLENELHFHAIVSQECEIVLYACDRLYVVSGHATLWFLLILPWGTE